MRVLGRIVVVLIALAAVAIALLEVASTQRRKALQPRQEESTLAILERLGPLESSAPPSGQDAGREAQPGIDGASPQRAGLAEDAPNSEQNAGRGSQPESGEASPQRAEEGAHEEQRSEVPRLKRAPNREEIAARFRPAQGLGRIITAAKLGFAKRLDGALYALSPERSKRFAAAIALDSADLGGFRHSPHVFP